MPQSPTEQDQTETPRHSDDRPVRAPNGNPRSAILIVAILSLTILCVWFGMYALSALRYNP